MTKQPTIEALSLLRELGAAPWLMRHHELVAEVASQLLQGLKKHFGLELDHDVVLSGAALHDCGKILHPNEMDSPGHEHEESGEALLLKHEVPANVARCCRTHGLHSDAELQLEDLLVALADKLWKGSRRRDLEEMAIEHVHAATGLDQWEVFAKADELFEAIASEGPERLARSDAPKIGRAR